MRSIWWCNIFPDLEYLGIVDLQKVEVEVKQKVVFGIPFQEYCRRIPDPGCPELLFYVPGNYDYTLKTI